MSRNFDGIDRRILEELQKNGRLSIVELARRVNLTKTPCSERVRRLESTGVIGGYQAMLNPASIGLNHLTIVHVSLKQSSDDGLERFKRAVVTVPEIQCCLMIAGHFDFMLQVLTRDIAHYREVLGDRIGKLPGVMQTHSFAVMETVKDSKAIAVDLHSIVGS